MRQVDALGARAVALARARPPGLGLPRALVVGTVGTVVLNGVTVCLNFALTLALSRALGVESYGAYAFAIAWATVLAVPAMLGLNPLLVREVAAHEARGSWPLVRGILRRSNQAVVASSAIVVALGAVAGWLLNRSQPELLRPYWVALLVVPLIALTGLRQGAMQGLGRVVLSRLPETVVGPLLLLALVVTASPALGDRFSATLAVAAHVATAFVAFAVGAWLLRRTVPDEARAAEPAYATRTWARSAGPLLVVGAVAILNVHLGTILLGSLAGADDAGVYNVAYRVAIFAGFLSIAGMYALSPAVARLYASGELAELQRLVSRSARAVLLGSLPIALALFVFARPVLELFGPEFDVGAGALRILVLGQLALVLAGFPGVTLVMTGHEGQLTKGIAAGTLATVALGVLLIPPWGAEGAAAATTAGLVLSNALLVYFAWSRAGINAAALGPQVVRP